jgi:hypothetical protein
LIGKKKCPAIRPQLSSGEMTTTIERVLQFRRAFLPTACLGSIRAMTINEAKNREFEGVIITLAVCRRR